MAYQSKNLSALGYANGFTLWHYRTDDPLLALSGLGYFDASHRMVRAGDFILVNAGEGAAATIVVASNKDGRVGLTTLVTTPFFTEA